MSTGPAHPIAIRVASALIAIGTVFVLPPVPMLLVLVVLGQGHIFLAFLYKAESGRMSGREWAITLAVLAFLAFFALHVSLNVLSFFTALGFLVHFCFDEARLLDRKNSLYTLLEMAPFSIFYASLVAEGYLNVHFVPYAAVLAAFVLIVYAIIVIRTKRAPNMTSYTFYAWTALAVVLYAAMTALHLASGIVWVWLLVVPHYIIWYCVYWFRLEADKPQLTKYVGRTLVINAVLIAGAYLLLGANIAPMALILSPVAFDVWTLLHEFSSVRLPEFRNSLRFNE